MVNMFSDCSKHMKSFKFLLLVPFADLALKTINSLEPCGLSKFYGAYDVVFTYQIYCNTF
jgi:hypothetical protein